MNTSDTYGTVSLSEHGREFVIAAEPHAVMLLKRHFPRLKSQFREQLRVTVTDETAHLLRWFTLGYPLDLDADAREAMETRAAAFDDRRTTYRKIARGDAELAAPPAELAVPLRDYQLIGVEMAHVSHGILLADQMGLGKTAQAIGLTCRPGTRPALIVCETHLCRQWKRAYKTFAPSLSVHVVEQGDPYDVRGLGGMVNRAATKRPFEPRGPGFPDVLVLSYSKLAKWGDVLRPVIKTVVYDEVQSLRNGESTKKGAAAAALSAAAQWRLGLSGTPVYNYGDEMYAVMDMLNPGILGTESEFLTEWCNGYRGRRRAVSDPAALGIHLRNLGGMLRRTRASVGRELPPVSRVAEEVPADRRTLDAMQGRAAELARIILDESTARPFDRLQASEELINKLRQATGIAKAPYVAGFVRQLVADGARPVVFGWHREVYELWRAAWALSDADTGEGALRVAWHTGTESAAEKASAVERFTRGEVDVLVISLRSGAGVDGLQHATNVCVFGELDWSPKVHDQCVTRIHRDGQDDPTTAYYLWADAGADPIMLDVCGAKRAQSDPMIDPDAEVIEGSEGDHVRRIARAVLNLNPSPDAGD